MYLPDSPVIHSHNYTLRGLYGRKFIEGEADAFIFDRKGSLLKGLISAGADTARDMAAALRSRDFADIPMAPVRRLVDSWAWHMGNRLGIRRKNSGETDISTGQKTVLDRHEQG